MHLNQWLLDWMRVPPDNKVHDFFTVLSWARRRSHFPCLILFAPRAWESGFVFKIRWTSSSPLPLNEGSAEAKGSVLWNGYCSVARDCWATSHAFGFIIRGLYTGAGSLPVFFFFPKAAENRIIGFVLRGKKNKRFCKQLWKKPNWSILEPPDLDSVPLMLYKHLFWVFNKLPADKLHNFLQEPLIFSRTTEMAKYILCLYNSLYICM